MQRHNQWGWWWYQNKGKRSQRSLKPIGYHDQLCVFQKRITISSKHLLWQILFSFVLLPPLISLVQYILMCCIICFNWFCMIYMSVRWNNNAKRGRSAAVGVMLSDFGWIAADLSCQFMIVIFSLYSCILTPNQLCLYIDRLKWLVRVVVVLGQVEKVPAEIETNRILWSALSVPKVDHYIW